MGSKATENKESEVVTEEGVTGQDRRRIRRSWGHVPISITPTSSEYDLRPTTRFWGSCSRPAFHSLTPPRSFHQHEDGRLNSNSSNSIRQFQNIVLSRMQWNFVLYIPLWIKNDNKVSRSLRLSQCKDFIENVLCCHFYFFSFNAFFKSFLTFAKQ